MQERLENQFRWDVVRPDSGAATLERIQQVMADVGPPQALIIHTLTRHIELSAATQEKERHVHDVYARLKSEPYDTLQRVTLVYAGKQGRDTVSLAYNVNAEGIHAHLEISNASSNEEIAKRLVKACSAHFKWATWEAARFVGMPEAYQHQVRAIEESFSKREERMNAAFERFVEQQEKAAAKLASDRAAFEVEKQREREAWQIERDQASAALKAKYEALELRERQIDLRDPLVVRREIQKQTNALLEQYEEFEVSQATRRVRLPVHVAAVVGTLGAVALYIWVASQILTRGHTDALRVSMLATATVILATVFGFYLRFLSSWFNLRARAEADIRTFRVDWLRASWLVELLFQWRRPGDGAEASALPPEVLAALSRGLFSESQEHDADAMKRLIAALPKVRRVDFGKLGGIEVDRAIDRPD